MIHEKEASIVLLALKQGKPTTMEAQGGTLASSPVATDQYSKFLTAFQFQSSTPDIVQIDVTWPAQFATPGWLAPLDPYVTPSYLNQFWPSARSIAEIDGKLYGIQRYMDIGMLYYRTDLVKKYGGTVPQTRDEMQATSHPLSYWNVKTNVWEIASGDYQVYVGASSRDIRLTGTLRVHQAEEE